MILHLILHHIARATVYLLGDIFLELWRGEGFLLSLGVNEVGRLHHDDRVFLRSAGDVLAQALKLPDLPVAKAPMILRVGDGIILHLHCREV